MDHVRNVDHSAMTHGCLIKNVPLYIPVDTYIIVYAWINVS